MVWRPKPHHHRVPISGARAHPQCRAIIAIIAHAIASRLFEGDEHSEVYDAMQDYFSRHLGRRQLP